LFDAINDPLTPVFIAFAGESVNATEEGAAHTA
jgi:hypothetical protein